MINSPDSISVRDLPVTKNGLPKIKGKFLSSSRSRIIKLEGKINSPTLIDSSSNTPLGCE